MVFPVHGGLVMALKELYTEEISLMIPFISREWLIKYVIQADVKAGLGFISLVMLPIISGLLFITLESSMRKSFKLPVRHLMLGQLLYALGSLFFILLIFLANFIWGILSPIAGYYLKLFNSTLETSHVQPISQLETFTISILVLMLFYWFATTICLKTWIRTVHIMISGCIFSLLWLAARAFLGFYIGNIARMDDLYGSLSSIVLIMMWMFYSSIALLLSVEVMHVPHHRPRPCSAGHTVQDDPTGEKT